jgi:hypothetical protein
MFVERHLDIDTIFNTFGTGPAYLQVLSTYTRDSLHLPLLGHCRPTLKVEQRL